MTLLSHFLLVFAVNTFWSTFMSYDILGGEARKNGHLTVQFRPSFEHMPKIPIWSWNGQPVNITCIAESIPNATIKWRSVPIAITNEYWC